MFDIERFDNLHVTSVGQKKKKYRVPDRIQTYDLPNTGRVLYPLGYGEIHGEHGHIQWYLY